MFFNKRTNAMLKILAEHFFDGYLASNDC